MVTVEARSASHLQIRAVVLGDIRTVALTENCDLLLDVLDLILSLLQVDGLDGNNALRTIIDTFKHLPEEEEEEKMSGVKRRERDEKKMEKAEEKIQ